MDKFDIEFGGVIGVGEEKKLVNAHCKLLYSHACHSAMSNL